MLAIIAIGDSIVFGRGELPATGWSGRIKNDFEKKAFNRCFFNLGYPGETTKSIKERFEVELKNRIRNPDEKDKFVILIGLGVNDSRAVNSKDNIEVVYNDYQDNIKELIDISKRYSKDIILLGLTPVDESRVHPFGNLYFLNSRIEQYTNFLKEISFKENIGYIDFYTPLNDFGFDKISGDGLHPNKEGYELMYNILRKYLEENKYIEF